MLNFITWNVDPEIFNLGFVAVRWYGLLFALSFLFGYLIIGRMFKRENIPAKLLDTLTTYMLVATIIGARLGHCLFYQPDYYLSNPIEILKIWEGGLASHGAAVGIILALYLFSRKTNRPFLWILDRIVVVVALAGAFIRTGNLMNSEIIGEPTNLPWAFVFTRIDSVPRHPAQLYEAISYLVIFVFLFISYWKYDAGKRKGFLFSMFLILVFAVRFLIEFVKEPQVGFEQGMALNMGQILSIPFVILGIIILVYNRKKSYGPNAKSKK